MICTFADSISGRENRDREIEEPKFQPSVAMPAPKNSKCLPATPGVRYWLQDSSCPVDLAGRKSLPEHILAKEEKSLELQDFDTANGVLPADTQVVMQVEGIPLDAKHYV